MMYRTTSYAENAWDVFWYEKNLQGDIVAVYNSSGTKLVTYDYYDAWGNYTVSYSNNGATTGAQYNPFRYRGYYYDSDLEMYYLQSRYYDAKICRFISPDHVSIITATPTALTDKNLFAYCDNNPVMRTDNSGMFWETALDVLSLGFSIAEVVINPANPRAWVGLAGDLVDLIPFVTGVGETTRAIKITVSLADGATDVVDAARKSYNILKKLDGAKDFIKATGSYEIVYKSGYKYVEKGSFYRSTVSALKHSEDYADEVISITWRSSPNKTWACIDEYAR